MPNVILGLQGAIATGSEPTFDGQPMQAGTHLHWSFSPELGFPPGGFWLCRKVAKGDEPRILPPSAVISSTAANSTGFNIAGQSAPGSPYVADVPPCQSVTVAGRASPGCSEVIVETFRRNSDGTLVPTGERVVRVEDGCFRVKISAERISCVRVAGAGCVDECRGEVEPPCDCGPGTGGGGTGQGGNPPPGSGPPGWGPPGDDGWQCWTVPFTLPVTDVNWPARYYGAPNPASTPDNAVVQADIAQAIATLHGLSLVAGFNAAQTRAEMAALRRELVRLVDGFPSTLLPDVALSPSPSGPNAPAVDITLMQQLLLLALNPYFARVLGLYFVDTDAKAGVAYDYCLTGYWGNTLCATIWLVPGLAPAAPLARGNAVFDGMTISPTGPSSHLWRWLRDDSNGNYSPQPDPNAPPDAVAAFQTAVSGIASMNQPEAMLAAVSNFVLWPFVGPPPMLTIELPAGASRVDVQLAGQGQLFGLSAGAAITNTLFNSAGLQLVTLTAPDPATALITAVLVVGGGGTTVVTVGRIGLHLLPADIIGTRYALLHAPHKLTPLAAPGQPVSTFRHRQADIDTKKLEIVPHSLIDVEWPAPVTDPSMLTGDPVTDPVALPPPNRPIGFVAERQDTGSGPPQRIPRQFAVASTPTPSPSKLSSARLYRLADSGLADPAGKWTHRVAGFDLFGALGHWSAWTAPMGVEKIAAAPTGLRIFNFDNTTAAGGAPDPPSPADPTAWKGGTLALTANWSAAAFLMYPDGRTARVTVESLDNSGNPTGILTTQDLPIPSPAIVALTIVSVGPPAAASEPNVFQVDVQTAPPLPVLGPRDPAAILMLTAPGGVVERYAVRPISLGSGSSVARLNLGPAANLVANYASFNGQPAYLVSGYGISPTINVPLVIPIDTNRARGRVSVTGSIENPFNAGDQVVDPNGINPSHSEPQSVALAFTGPQQLIPPAPPTPVHTVDHIYYDPADFNGRASKILSFTAAARTGVSGYVLLRAPLQSLILADTKRRIALGTAADPNPVLSPPRPDLAAWIGVLPDWLSQYNAARAHQTPPLPSLTLANVLSDAAGRRAFIDHFYGGLLDDELRALADLTGNSTGFVRLNPTPLAPGEAVADTVDGTGYGRNIYRLAAVNSSGSASPQTNSIGPYYTQIVTPPRPPVLYRVQASEAAIVVAWTLDSNPDVAAYLVYRGASVADLADLRYFGPDPSHPAVSGLAAIQYNPQKANGLSFSAGSIDPRIAGFVPDPRLCARDYTGSDMGEVPLPPGPPPDKVDGVYRLSDYGSGGAFNYWTPPATGGIAQLVTDSPLQSRLTGLRIGLGRGVSVVVVVTIGGTQKVFGRAIVRRAAFTDGSFASGNPVDANAIAGSAPASTTALNTYAVVGVDIFGNRSLPSKVFAAQMLAKAAGS